MTDELRRSIDRIRELSPKLNAATDDANRVVLAVEHFLNDACKLGLPAYVSVYVREKVDPRRNVMVDEPTMTLEYMRVDGKFRIAVGKLNDEDDDGPRDEWSYRAWQDSPRGVKLETFPHLPELLETLSKKVESSIDKTQETCATVEKVVGAFELHSLTSGALLTMTTKAVRDHIDKQDGSLVLNPDAAGEPCPPTARQNYYEQRTQRGY